MTWFFVVIESSPIYKSHFGKGVWQPEFLTYRGFFPDSPDSPWVLLKHLLYLGPSWDDPQPAPGNLRWLRRLRSDAGDFDPSPATEVEAAER